VTNAIFVQLLSDQDKATALSCAIADMRGGKGENPALHIVDPAIFGRVSSSPFAYWVSDALRSRYVDLPPFEGDGRTVTQGLATADDFRFVRLWWEVSSRRILAGQGVVNRDPREFQAAFTLGTFQGRRWAPFAKGSDFSPYFNDIQTVLNWEQDGQELKAWAGSLYGGSHWSRILKNVDFYFRLDSPGHSEEADYLLKPFQRVASSAWQESLRHQTILTVCLLFSLFSTVRSLTISLECSRER
jgi:hypothetical protein